MDYVEYLKEQTQLGYSKTELEKCLGLSRNILSGVVSGKKKLSAKARLKIDVWAKLEGKPSPLDVKNWLQIRIEQTSTNKKVWYDREINQENKLTTLVKETTENLFDGVDVNTIDEVEKFEIEYPTEYNEWLRMVKKGIGDIDNFKTALSASKLNQNQKAMVLSKI